MILYINTYTNYSNIHLSMDLIGGFVKYYFNLFNSSNFIGVFYNNGSLNILISILEIIMFNNNDYILCLRPRKPIGH